MTKRTRGLALAAAVGILAAVSSGAHAAFSGSASPGNLAATGHLDVIGGDWFSALFGFLF